MPDKKPVTHKELMKGILPALGIHLALAVLLGGACGAFVPGQDSWVARELTAVGMVILQGTTLIVVLIGSFVGEEKGIWIGWILGTVLALLSTLFFIMSL